MILETNQSTRVSVEGREYLYFGGTNYLGLAHRRELMDAAEEAFARYGFSCGASRLTSGENTLMVKLEEELAHFAHSEDSLVLPAGFMSNTAVVDGIEHLVDYWLIHKQAHGSIKSAVARSKKPIIEYDLEGTDASLREQHRLKPGCVLGVFAEPIDPLLGQVFPVSDLHGRCAPHDFLILDEAHSFGVLGAHGIGALEYFHLQNDDKLIRTGTFSKALGSYGGFVLGATNIIDMIKLNSSSYKVSTALSPLACGANRAALKLMREDKASTIDLLKENISRMNNDLSALGFEHFNEREHAVPIYYLANSPVVAELRDALPKEGICMPTVTSYFAGFCEIGIRWTIQAGHTDEDFARLKNVMESHLAVRK